MRAVRKAANPSNPADLVEVVEVDTPSGDGVRVRVTSSGICGSDIHLAELGFPMTFGHEFAGVTEDGRAFSVQPMRWCGTCDICATGRHHVCREAGKVFYGVSSDGGMCDELVVDPACLAPLPATVPITDAILAEPLAVGWHALTKAGVQAGQRVCVIGGGTIGLGIAAVARHRGIDVDLIARHPHQRAAAERLGARIGARPDVMTAGVTDYDIVVESAGTQSAIDEAIRLCRPGGIVVIPGTYWHPVSIGTAITGKEVTLMASVVYGIDADGVREFDRAIEVLAAAPDVADTIITHRFSLDDAPEAFRVAGDRKAGAIKVVLDVNRG